MYHVRQVDHRSPILQPQGDHQSHSLVISFSSLNLPWWLWLLSSHHSHAVEFFYFSWELEWIPSILSWRYPRSAKTWWRSAWFVHKNGRKKDNSLLSRVCVLVGSRIGMSSRMDDNERSDLWKGQCWLGRVGLYIPSKFGTSIASSLWMPVITPIARWSIAELKETRACSGGDSWGWLLDESVCCPG